jgi:hypothetical protein
MTSSSARPHSAGDCLVPDCERVRVNVPPPEFNAEFSELQGFWLRPRREDQHGCTWIISDYLVSGTFGDECLRRLPSPVLEAPIEFRPCAADLIAAISTSVRIY